MSDRQDWMDGEIGAPRNREARRGGPRNVGAAVRTPPLGRLGTAAGRLAATLLLLATFAAGAARARGHAAGTTVQVRLSEWKVELSPATVPAGPVTFRIVNAGTIPHAFEVEGRGVEKSTSQVQPGEGTTLAVTLAAGTYETYCPVGGDSHKMLGMDNHLAVAAGRTATAAPVSGHGAMTPARSEEDDEMAAAAAHDHGAMAADGDQDEAGEYAAPRGKAMRVSGGGPVIQILPGPFPFADSALAVIRSRPADQEEDLTHKAHLGPYSNNVARIAGDISILAVDRGATGDSVSGTAEFTTKDGARWKLVMDRVQTKDIPFNPRFGGVIMGLYYHGATGVHTPLVPTIRSSLALWAYAHLYRDGRLVTDDAMVHVMLLSRTRHDGDFALECWDCSRNPIEELQLQVTPAPGEPAFDAPGGFLFVNWEKSSGTLLASK